MDDEIKSILLSQQREIDDLKGVVRQLSQRFEKGRSLPGPDFPVFFTRRGSTSGLHTEQVLVDREWTDAQDGKRRECTDADGNGSLIELDSDMVACLEFPSIDENGERFIAKAVLGGGGAIEVWDLEDDGGADGDESTAPTYTYTATDRLSGADRGETLSPLMQRTVGSYVPAAIGIGIRESDGTYAIVWCDEVPSISAPCDPPA